MKVKYPKLTRCRYDFMHWYDIPSRDNPGQVYLRRFRIIQTPQFSILFHKIYEPDDGLYPHDHPWNWFRTFILRGGYCEDFYSTYSHLVNDRPIRNVWKKWSSHKVTHTQAHHITYVWPNTWTLVVTGKRIRKFCFWTPNGKVPYDKMGELNDVE